jgi:uncharacterized UPF0146 family protein
MMQDDAAACTDDMMKSAAPVYSLNCTASVITGVCLTWSSRVGAGVLLRDLMRGMQAGRHLEAYASGLVEACCFGRILMIDS